MNDPFEGILYQGAYTFLTRKETKKNPPQNLSSLPKAERRACSPGIDRMFYFLKKW
jgi:hypothetical protein